MWELTNDIHRNPRKYRSSLESSFFYGITNSKRENENGKTGDEQPKCAFKTVVYGGSKVYNTRGRNDHQPIPSPYSQLLD